MFNQDGEGAKRLGMKKQTGKFKLLIVFELFG
jgi:hypothetical protein